MGAAVNGVYADVKLRSRSPIRLNAIKPGNETKKGVPPNNSV